MFDLEWVMYLPWCFAIQARPSRGPLAVTCTHAGGKTREFARSHDLQPSHFSKHKIIEAVFERVHCRFPRLYEAYFKAKKPLTNFIIQDKGEIVLSKKF